MISPDKEIRAKDLETMSGLRRRVVELEMENKSLKKLVPETNCATCRFCVCIDGIFRRCSRNDMRIVYAEGYCSDGKRRKF